MRQRFLLSVSIYFGMYEMSYLNLQQATRNNPIYAWTTKPAWKERFYQVTNELGFFYQTPSPEAFAQAVYQWQSKQPGLKADGILGPKSWAKLEPKTRYSIDVSGPLPLWISTMPEASEKNLPERPQKNGITDTLEESIRKDPSYQTTLINAGVFVGSVTLGNLKQLSALQQFGASAIVQPLVWAFQGNTGDDIDKLLYALGLFPTLTVAAGITGIWKGLMDDDVLTKLEEVKQDEPSYLSKAIYPTAIYGWSGPALNAQTIASKGGVAWQHPNGLWVFLKLEKKGKEVLVCDYKPKNAVKILGPELPLKPSGTRFVWRSYKGGF